MMDLNRQILSDITVHMKYAKYIPELRRRETWDELVSRNADMHLRKFPNLKTDIVNAYKYVYDKKILPSMRSLQFSGKPIEISPNRIFNCSYLPVDHYAAFSEIMFMLLSGCGIGYSVQKCHTEKLPEIRKPSPTKTRRWLVSDSIEGWSDAVKVLMKSYFKGSPRVIFDFRDIRPKGARLVTSGGKAPGPQPLIECLVKIEGILSAKTDGDQLTPIEIHDVVCHIADAVLAGGIRRAALISLFDPDDIDMLSAKTGDWWELNPQRGRANNSVVLLRHKTTLEEFNEIWKRIEMSNAGEPGLFFSNNQEVGTNPCCEIALSANGVCNLTEVNVSDIESQEDLNNRVKAAAFIGTLQASYTNFHYLRSVWQRTAEKEALLGIGMTGIASNEVFKYNLSEAARIALIENERVAKLIGINKALRVTCVKPSGTTSLCVGTSSGIHAWHSEYYIRRIRVNKNEAIYKYLLDTCPEILEDEYFRPHDTAVISIPQKAPTGATLRTESPIDLLERVKKVQSEWVAVGHRKGDNKHNVSVTVSVKPDEWEAVGKWMWENRSSYAGISILPYDGGSYKQAPFEEIDEETYLKLSAKLHAIDVTQIMEDADETDLRGEVACAGGACEV